jgi:hypothetical protein
MPEWPASTAEMWGIRLEVAGDRWAVAAAELVDVGSQLRYTCSFVGAGQRREDKPGARGDTRPATLYRQVAFGSKTKIDQPILSERPELSPWASWQEHEARKQERIAAKAALMTDMQGSALASVGLSRLQHSASSVVAKREQAAAAEAEAARVVAVEAARVERERAELEAQKQIQLQLAVRAAQGRFRGLGIFFHSEVSL